MFIKDVSDTNPFTNCCCHSNISTCFNTVRNDLVMCSMKTFNPFNSDNVSTCTTDMSSHIVQQCRNINDFWFTSGIFDDSTTFSFCRSKYCVDCCTNTNSIHIDMSSMNWFFICCKTHCFAFIRYLSSHSFKSFQVKVNWTRTKVATTWKTYCCFTKSAK